MKIEEEEKLEESMMVDKYKVLENLINRLKANPDETIEKLLRFDDCDYSDSCDDLENIMLAIRILYPDMSNPYDKLQSYPKDEQDLIAILERILSRERENLLHCLSAEKLEEIFRTAFENEVNKTLTDPEQCNK